MRVLPCPKCEGKRLNDKTLSVKINDKNIIHITDMSITNAVDFFSTLKLSKKQMEIANLILKELKHLKTTTYAKFKR